MSQLVEGERWERKKSPKRKPPIAPTGQLYLLYILSPLKNVGMRIPERLEIPRNPSFDPGMAMEPSLQWVSWWECVTQGVMNSK